MKYDGTERRRWFGHVARQDGPLIVVDAVFDEEIKHDLLGTIASGTISKEYYWLDRWYSIFRFHEPSGSLRNFYCNLNMPPVFADGVLDYVDLDIDVVVWPDFSYKVLDRDDYEVNSRLFGYSNEVKAKVEATLQEVLERIEARDLPNGPDKFATSATDFRESS